MALNVGPANKRRAHAGNNVWNVLQAVAKSHFDFFKSVSGQLTFLSYFRIPPRRSISEDVSLRGQPLGASKGLTA
ncbi:hypothetical protein QTN24_17420 [Cupriavidus sp. SZY C1]|uniref:hypothetical protein n=1 Tax=Cupriavidus sp. SZY C1 TaxID=3055037 RepID=UPI0028B969FB|nr:hypothetical protein [Cupriavidus sp. SZY C1]MDT6963281.1 hypothetical protein [Cupriavidus sp. SZY C1]